MKDSLELNNNNDLSFELSKKRKHFIYDKINLSPKSKTIIILRAMIISLCCFFFPLEAVVENRLQEIEMNLYVENKLFSILISTNLINSISFHLFIDIVMTIIGSKEAIMVFISLIYLIIHPFIGLKLILISSTALYFVILLQIIFQAHRPFWDLEQSETICRNTYPNPSSILFYCFFFYLYAIISFNLLKKQKFLPIQKIFIFTFYILFLIIILIIFGGAYLLYIHQIIYTFVISIVVICLLIDFDTNIHNFIFNSLKNVYNTRVYKMKIFFYVCGLYFIGFISLYFIEENNINKIKDNIITSTFILNSCAVSTRQSLPVTPTEIGQERQCSCCEHITSRSVIGKDCRVLTAHELRRYGGKIVFINGKWMEEPEVVAYVGQLHMEIAELKDEIKILREILSRHTEEEYD